MHVVEYDGKSLLSLKQNKTDDTSKIEAPMTQPNNYYNHHLAIPSLPVPPAPEQHHVEPNLKIEGLNDAVGARYSSESHTMNPNGSTMQFNTASFLPPNQYIGSSGLSQLPRNDDTLSLGPPQPSFPGFNPASTSNFYRGTEELLSEEEIRMRSNEMLEHDDMQHLLRIFGMGHSQGQNLVGATEDLYPYSSSGYAPAPSPAINFNFDDDKVRSSGKAVVGWLKLKAALRWGIFIRKKAAEKRAKLTELDDT